MGHLRNFFVFAFGFLLSRTSIDYRKSLPSAPRRLSFQAAKPYETYHTALMAITIELAPLHCFLFFYCPVLSIWALLLLSFKVPRMSFVQSFLCFA